VRGYLLDTNAALIALTDPAGLPHRVRSALLAGPNVLSVIVYWEVLLKTMKGALKVGDPRTWWLGSLEQLAASPLALRPEHVSGVYDLPEIHRNPFDRVLIAQAAVEALTLVTVDSVMSRYVSKRLHIIS
jgi:PIN domain nuclease of toxin-antitoxin system